MAAQLAVRLNAANPNHHLWNNNGTWWLHYTIHLPDFTKRRVRLSLRTPVLARARELRDQFLSGRDEFHLVPISSAKSDRKTWGHCPNQGRAAEPLPEGPGAAGWARPHLRGGLGSQLHSALPIPNSPLSGLPHLQSEICNLQ